jgi:CDP-glucose 4,6-dehydratase
LKAYGKASKLLGKFGSVMQGDLKDFYKNKKVFITGHTGFKGSWLSLFLKYLGADLSGYALSPEDGRDNLYDLVGIDQIVRSNIADIRDIKLLREALNAAQPEIIFHLAAQPLVRDSYSDPVYNYETNVIGTVNLLEAAKTLKSVKAVVNITTDKCYENNEWYWSYRENDRLGGHDPYSASKACSEIVTNSYRQSFYHDLGIGLASARAGNVIGGGDFSKDRIIPDIISAICKNEEVTLRNPNAVRPWQHVLDVLNGYLLLGMKLYQVPKEYSESFNFSPLENQEVNVEAVVQQFISVMKQGSYRVDKSAAKLHEAQMLKLDSSKAAKKLNWIPKYKAEKSITNTALWYKEFLDESDVISLCHRELEDFINNKHNQ